MNKISHKKLSGRISVSPSEVEVGVSKSLLFFLIWEQQNRFTLGLSTEKNTTYQKVLWTKILQSWIYYEKLTGCTSLSSPGVELEGSTDSPIFKYYMGYITTRSYEVSILLSNVNKLFIHEISNKKN